MYVCTYVCMHACMYACMYVCMYVCVYTSNMYIYIYMYAHPPTTPKNALFAHFSITVIRQRLRKSKTPKLQKSKNLKIQKFRNPKTIARFRRCKKLWTFGFFLGILEFFILEFWGLRFFGLCSVFFVDLCVVCLLCLAAGIHL